MIRMIHFELNGRRVRLRVEGERKLLWVLRTELGLTGTKFGCGKGICGACTVLVDRKAVRSCQVPIQEVQGKRLLTIEGLAKEGQLHPLQKAFIEFDALQCGFCTPGMILTALSLLAENPNPSEAEVIQGMDDNLCRCGSHQRIVQAILSASKDRRGK